MRVAIAEGRYDRGYSHITKKLKAGTFHTAISEHPFDNYVTKTILA